MLDFSFVLADPAGREYDVTERVVLEGLSKISLSVERNLHEFRAGDLTVSLDDGDGFVSGLFAGVEPSDRWSLRVHRDGAMRFSGTVVPIDSVHFDLKEKVAEITALDLSKTYEEIDATPVRRSVLDYLTTGTNSAGATTLTLASTAGLYNGDELRLASTAATEDVTILFVASATSVTLTAALGNTYAAGTPATLTTPFYRFQTPEFLIGKLLDEAAPPGRVVRLTSSGGSLSVSDVSTNLLPNVSTMPAYVCSRSAQATAAQPTSARRFEQATADADWIDAGVWSSGYEDWSPFFASHESEPGYLLHEVAESTKDRYSWKYGATTYRYVPLITILVNERFEISTASTTDGATWSGSTTFAVVESAIAPLVFSYIAVEYDRARDRVYYSWKKSDGTGQFGYYNSAGGGKTVLASYGLDLLRYSRERDVVVGQKDATTIEIWQGDLRIAVRTLALGNQPRTIVPPESMGIRTLRWIGTAAYFLDYQGLVPQLHFSDDDFATERIVPLAAEPATPRSAMFSRCCVVSGTYRVFVYGPNSTVLYFVAAPYFAGVISYADFEDMAVSNALDELAVVANGVFSVDLYGVAYFVSRDLDSGMPQVDVGDLVLERTEDPLWLETYDFVQVSGPNGVVGVSGVRTSISRNLEVTSQLATSVPVATSIAVYLHVFFSKRRRVDKVSLDDVGVDYRLLDPIRLDGVDWIVYASERDLGAYEIGLDLLERV